MPKHPGYRRERDYQFFFFDMREYLYLECQKPEESTAGRGPLFPISSLSSGAHAWVKKALSEANRLRRHLKHSVLVHVRDVLQYRGKQRSFLSREDLDVLLSTFTTDRQ